MIQIKPPQESETISKGLFLAGAITGAPNWQEDVVRLLGSENITIFNPRRDIFPVDNPNSAEAQIRWECKYLRRADAISFWFAMESLSPIVLYELGAWSMTEKTIFVGVHPKYKRRLDIEIQTKLVRPDVRIAYSLDSLVDQIKTWSKIDDTINRLEDAV